MPQLQPSNFHLNLSHEFGRKALKLFRFIERRYISDAKWSNHLHFNLSLKRYNIFPVSLSVSSSVKGPKAEKILFKAKRALLSERIRQTLAALKTIRRDRQEAEAQLGALVGAANFSSHKTRFSAAFTLAFNKTRNKQKVKMCKLVTKNRITEKAKEKTIVNISKERATVDSQQRFQSADKIYILATLSVKVADLTWHSDLQPGE